MILCDIVYRHTGCSFQFLLPPTPSQKGSGEKLERIIKDSHKGYSAWEKKQLMRGRKTPVKSYVTLRR